MKQYISCFNKTSSILHYNTVCYKSTKFFSIKIMPFIQRHSFFQCTTFDNNGKNFGPFGTLKLSFILVEWRSLIFICSRRRISSSFSSSFLNFRCVRDTVIHHRNIPSPHSNDTTDWYDRTDRTNTFAMTLGGASMKWWGGESVLLTSKIQVRVKISKAYQSGKIYKGK